MMGCGVFLSPSIPFLSSHFAAFHLSFPSLREQFFLSRHRTDYQMTKQLSQLGAAARKIIISNEVEQNLVNESKYISLLLPCTSCLPKPEAPALLPAGFSYCLLCIDMRQQSISSSPHGKAHKQGVLAWSKLSLW